MLTLYPEPLVPSITPVNPSWNPFGKDLHEVLASCWLEVMDGFEYGNLTAYLLRAYGYPNICAGDPFHHTHAWGLATPGGHLLKIECRPLILKGFSQSKGRDRSSMIRALVSSHCLTILPVTIAPSPITTDLLFDLCRTFKDPIYVGEQGADAMGVLPEERDIGPGSHHVRRAGLSTVNLIIPPGVSSGSQNPELDQNTLRIVTDVHKKIFL